MTQRYDQSFRNEAIRLATTVDKSVAQTAKDLGIKEPTRKLPYQEDRCKIEFSSNFFLKAVGVIPSNASCGRCSL